MDVVFICDAENNETQLLKCDKKTATQHTTATTSTTNYYK